MIGPNFREITYLYELDDRNKFGFLHYHTEDKQGDQDANYHMKFSVQSDKMYLYSQHMTFPYTNYPMQELNIKTRGLT